MPADADPFAADPAGTASTDEVSADGLRRLLATEPDPPLPPEVIARINAALSAEAAGRTDEEPTAVVPLRQRRSRRWVVPAAVAASVVAVVGIGSQVVTTMSGGSAGSSSSLADPAARDAVPGPTGTTGDGGAAGSRSDGGKEGVQQDQRLQTDQGNGQTAPDRRPALVRTDPRLHAETLTADLEMQVADAGLTPRPTRWLPIGQDTCRRLSPSRSTGVRLDGDPAYLVVDAATRRYLIVGCEGGRATQLADAPTG